jgi:hypothetical protein
MGRRRLSGIKLATRKIQDIKKIKFSPDFSHNSMVYEKFQNMLSKYFSQMNPNWKDSFRKIFSFYKENYRYIDILIKNKKNYFYGPHHYSCMYSMNNSKIYLIDPHIRLDHFLIHAARAICSVFYVFKDRNIIDISRKFIDKLKINESKGLYLLIIYNLLSKIFERKENISDEELKANIKPCFEIINYLKKLK